MCQKKQPMNPNSCHPCPICHQNFVSHWELYPLAVCQTCYGKVSDRLGRQLTFFNTSPGGGFAAQVIDTEEEYLEHICYIDDIECWAEEARFGGIVIQAKKTIKFYHLNQPYSFFSNFSPHSIYLKNKIWPTTEHYFQSQKFADIPQEETIRQASSPREAAALGRDRRLPLRRDWEIVKENVMREALYAKFTQHPDLQEQLLATQGSVLIEHTANDRYWGDGGDGTGLNRLGYLLMEIRQQISTNTTN